MGYKAPLLKIKKTVLHSNDFFQINIKFTKILHHKNNNNKVIIICAIQFIIFNYGIIMKIKKYSCSS